MNIAKGARAIAAPREPSWSPVAGAEGSLAGHGAAPQVPHRTGAVCVPTTTANVIPTLQGTWNWMVFKVPSNLNKCVINHYKLPPIREL